jgi:ubiquinone/menaquinone biosynthesis C-methylase UbiE
MRTPVRRLIVSAGWRVVKVSTVRGMVTYDEELRAHNERLRAATGVRAGDRVVDVGCGMGQTTREAARAAAPGDVLGIDVSGPALERARELAAADGLDNVAYVEGDCQTHPFEPRSFDVAISRFGVMFFSDPIAAFANIARALRPDGRLVTIVWQRHGDNEWAVAIDEAVGSTTAEGLSAFSLGDPDVTTPILERAGFGDVRFEDVQEPMFFGRDVPDALEWVTGFSDIREALATMAPDARDGAIERLRATLARHRTADGVNFGSRAWLVTARRR